MTAARYGREKPSTATGAPSARKVRAATSATCVEGGPQNRRPNRSEVEPAGARFGRQLQEGAVETMRAGNTAVVEIAVLVVEGQIAIEPERTEVREVLDLVRSVETGSDRRQRDEEQEHEDSPAGSSVVPDLQARHGHHEADFSGNRRGRKWRRGRYNPPVRAAAHPGSKRNAHLPHHASPAAGSSRERAVCPVILGRCAVDTGHSVAYVSHPPQFSSGVRDLPGGAPRHLDSAS